MACQLTFEERERLSQLHEDGESARAIADQLGRSPSTISRELRRNSEVGHYSAVVAQGKWLERRRQRPLERKLERPRINTDGADCFYGYTSRRGSYNAAVPRRRA